MWLNPNSANKASIAIGGVVKETKPGKVLVEDDEGKVSVARDLGGRAPSLGAEPWPFSDAAPQSRVGGPRGRTEGHPVTVKVVCLSWGLFPQRKHK